MAAPARRTPPANRRRSFDLRSTALFFVLLAVVVSILGFAARTAVDIAERHPGWAFVLLLLGVAGIAALGRRLHLARAARRAAAALDEAATEAAEVWETATVPRQRAAFGVDIDYDALDAEEFEAAVAHLCERDGCSDVEAVGGAGDLGADVVAVSPEGWRVVIQCKRYGDSHRVGSQDIQRFGGTCFAIHEADVAVLVTTSDFTAPAVEYAEQCGIVCVDRQALLCWAEGSGPRPWEAVRAVRDVEAR
ncbi:restriction endonuclease [Streptomyces sp. NWU339]|uniref:restriction endonuclease n=1 Tax=Streptomyces sp. NWU339 TaxID=2185284 RepID=UPI00215A7BB4|nr:restriction endonuclease [Streptomyces sp. NWU339]